MTVQEMIDQLNKIEDKTKTIIIEVHVETKRYPVAYIPPVLLDNCFRQFGENVRISTWLPENMYTVEKKSK